MWGRLPACRARRQAGSLPHIRHNRYSPYVPHFRPRAAPCGADLLRRLCRYSRLCGPAQPAGEDPVVRHPIALALLAAGLIAVSAAAQPPGEPRQTAEWGSPLPPITLESDRGFLQTEFLYWY